MWFRNRAFMFSVDEAVDLASGWPETALS